MALKIAPKSQKCDSKPVVTEPVVTEPKGVEVAGYVAASKAVFKQFNPLFEMDMQEDGVEKGLEYLASVSLKSYAPPSMSESTSVFEELKAGAHSVKSPVELTELQALVYELLDLEDRMQKLEVADMIKRKEELRKSIMANLTEPIHQPVTIVLPQGSVEFGAGSKAYEVTDKNKLFGFLGGPLAIEMAKFSVTELKKVVSENAMLTFGEYKQTASRSMKIKLNHTQ